MQSARVSECGSVSAEAAYVAVTNVTQLSCWDVASWTELCQLVITLQMMVTELLTDA